MDDTAVAPAAQPSSTRTPARPRRWGGVPATVWAVTALHVGLLLVFTLLYPPFAGFDETQHVDAVLSIRHGDGWPAPQERELSEGIVQVATPVLGALDDAPFSDDALLPRSERPSVASLGVERDSTGQLLPNQMTQHPPLPYAVGAAVLAAVPGSADWPFDLTVGVLRLLGVLLTAPLPLLAWATAGALGAGRVVAVTAAALPLSVPQLHRVGASVNNDALANLLFAAAVLLLVRLARGDLRLRTAALTGVVVGLALLTKGFALVLPPALGLCVLAGGLRTGRRTWWRPALLGLVVAFAVGGWWWLRNLLVHGAVQPAGWPAEGYRRALGLTLRPPGTPAPLDDFVAGAYVRLSTRFLGELGIGYAGPPTYPHAVVHLLVAACAAALVVALLRARGSRAALLAAVVVPFAGTLAIVVYGMWTGYLETLAYPGAQGRYLFGSLPGAAAGVAVGAAAVAGRARRLLPLLAVLLGLALQAVGVYDVLRRYWLPPYGGQSRVERYEQALTGIAAWAPWPTPVTAAVVVATGAAAAVLAVLVVRSARRDPA